MEENARIQVDTDARRKHGDAWVEESCCCQGPTDEHLGGHGQQSEREEEHVRILRATGGQPIHGEASDCALMGPLRFAAVAWAVAQAQHWGMQLTGTSGGPTWS